MFLALRKYFYSAKVILIMERELRIQIVPFLRGNELQDDYMAMMSFSCEHNITADAFAKEMLSIVNPYLLRAAPGTYIPI